LPFLLPGPKDGSDRHPAGPDIKRRVHCPHGNKMTTLFISLTIKLFFLLTPFFVLSVFLSMTEYMTKVEQRRVAIRTTLSVMVISLVLYFAGNPIFSTLGITLDGFRIGAGSLLFLSAVSLVSGKRSSQEAAPDVDFAVVPLAIPLLSGPGAISTVIVYAYKAKGPLAYLITSAGILLIGLAIYLSLLAAPYIAKKLGRTGINIITRIMGLILAAISVEFITTGLKNIFQTLS